VVASAQQGAGTLLVPTRDGTAGDLRHAAGADLLTEAPSVAGWLSGLDGSLVLGNYVYADGATNVRVSVAVDALTTRLQELRQELALAFLATPTDVFVCPATRWSTRHAATSTAPPGPGWSVARCGP
jgi:hypothetical protein